MSGSSLPVVLLVDDESNVLAALRRGLRREALSIETAGDAKQALDRLTAGPVDLVVTDHRMPGMSGVELLAIVRDRWPATARILLSGWSSEIAESQRSLARPFAVLSKPWDGAVLRSAIREGLARSSTTSTRDRGGR
ncbi:MAG: hypothetical protein CL908_00340 [Deltaproteobacteria bacterium]|nr:hypothetical protein [Deltaproteobacteria bacterium]